MLSTHVTNSLQTRWVRTEQIFKKLTSFFQKVQKVHSKSSKVQKVQSKMFKKFSGDPLSINERCAIIASDSKGDAHNSIDLTLFLGISDFSSHFSSKFNFK